MGERGEQPRRSAEVQQAQGQAQGTPASQTLFVLINRLVAPAAALVLLMLVGRESDLLLGQYALLTAFYVVMQTLPLLGLTPFVMREVARQPEEAGTYFTTIGLLALTACAVLNGVGWAIGHTGLYDTTIAAGLRVVGYCIAPGILAFIAESILISLHRTRGVAVTAVLSHGLRLVLSAAVLVQGGGVVALLWVLFATQCVALASYVVLLVRGARVRVMRLPDWKLLRRVWLVLPTFFTHAVLLVVLSRLDYLVLSVFATLETVGYYAIAYRCLEIALLVAGAIYTALFPRLARQYAQGPERFFQRAALLFLVALSSIIPLACLGYTLAEPYVWVLFREQYPTPVPFARAFSLVFILGGLNALLSTVLHAADLQRADVVALAGGGLVYAIALLALVPPFGVVGALAATVLTMCVQLVLRVRAYQRERRGALIRTPILRRVALAGVALIVAAMWVTQVWRWGAPPVVAIIALTAYPVVLAWVGLWQPLRLWQHLRHATRRWPPDTVRAFADDVVRDVRQAAGCVAVHNDAMPDSATGASPLPQWK